MDDFLVLYGLILVNKPTEDDLLMVRISPTSFVPALKSMINEKRPDAFPTTKMTIWKLNEPIFLDEDYVTKVKDLDLDPSNSKVERLGISMLSKHFPSQPNGELLHFIIVRPIVPMPSRVESYAEPIPPLRRKTSQEVYDPMMAGLPAPSSFAAYFKQTLEQPKFLNHRPWGNTGTPTVLMHPIFAQFVDDCDRLQPTDHDFSFTLSLCQSMPTYYKLQADRMTDFRELLNTYLGLNEDVLPIVIDGNTTDGTLLANKSMVMNVEGKREQAAKGDAHIQNLAYYTKHCTQNNMKARRWTGHPCILVMVTGPFIGIASALYGKRFTTDLYHSFSLARSRYELEPIARIFAALKKAIFALRDYYNHLPPHPDTSVDIHFPFLTSFTNLDGDTMHFKYCSRLGQNFLLFVVELDSEAKKGDKMLVKFIRRYGVDAHRACANLGIAPEIYGFVELSGGWKAVVMEYLKEPFKELSHCLKDEDTKRAIERAVATMHTAGFVHGDIRQPNIFYHPGSGGGVKILDWDWAGEAGATQYPLGMNREQVARPADAIGNGLIEAAHDNWMVDNIFNSGSGDQNMLDS